MKKFDVYGIGNALVDMVYEVDESYLKEMEIEKGLMTLIDENKQNGLIDSLKEYDAKRCCGGSAANTMIAISQYGGNSFYSCKVAKDETGNFYMTDMEANGVETNLSHKERQDGITGKCLVFVTPDADRTMNTFLGITETFSVDELDENSLKEAEYLYIEGYLVTSPTGRKAAVRAREIARENGVKVSITFSDPGMVNFFKEGLDEMMGGKVDLIFCNEEEALAYTKCNDVKEAIEKLKDISETIAITCGPNGAIMFDGEKIITVDGIKVDAKDTNGAGDLFAGSFLYAITHGMNFEQAGKLACMASSKLVTKYGARLEKDEIQEVLKKL